MPTRNSPVPKRSSSTGRSVAPGSSSAALSPLPTTAHSTNSRAEGNRSATRNKLASSMLTINPSCTADTAAAAIPANRANTIIDSTRNGRAGLGVGFKESGVSGVGRHRNAGPNLR